MREPTSIYLEPTQEREMADLLRHATLSGQSVIADCTRSHRGVRVTFGIITNQQARKIQRILNPPNQ